MDMDREVKLLRDIEALVMERERLRAALQEIAKMPTWTGQGAGWAAGIAQRALEQSVNSK